MLALAGVALIVSIASAFLLASAAPYLSMTDVWPLSLAGAGYAGAAAYLATARVGTSHLVALLVISAGAAAPALSLGLAQDSGAWIVVAAAAGFVVPAVGWVCVAALRGDSWESLERWLVLSAGVLVAGAATVEALVRDPGTWGWCRCVTNPVAVTQGSGVFLDLQPWLTGAHLLAVAFVLVAVGRSLWERPGRRGVPELVLTGGLLLLAGSWIIQDLASLAGTPTDATTVAAAAGLATALAVDVIRSSRRRPSRAHVADLLLAARERSEPARLRELVARAVGDPRAAVYWWDRSSASYVDHEGRLAPSTTDMPPDHVLEVASGDRPIARVVSERPLVDDPGIVEPVAEALRLSTENLMLQEDLAASLAQVRESRSRIVQASDEARRRIERDLHDGAQQLLISTGAKLNLASTRIDPAHDPQLADTLAEASDELGRALDELRTLARGITPTALVHGSLPDAMEDLALRCPVPTVLHVEGDAEVLPEVAATAYFVVGECLANVAKHADASTARIHLELTDPLQVTIRDDGHGGADPSKGTGLRGLIDRVEALGGSFEVNASSGGTTLTATLPNLAQRSEP